MKFILGLTGGIGSGKSAASSWFEKQNIIVVDADVVAREIVDIGQPALKQITDVFGLNLLLEDGSLNRRALREIVFQSNHARKQLEEITHPAIRTSIIHQLEAADSPYVILVSPLLFETNQHELTQRTLLIDASIDLQIQRAAQRDTQNIEQIQKIIAAQMPREEKQKRANDIVLNDGHLDHLHQALEKLHKKYLDIAHAK